MNTTDIFIFSVVVIFLLVADFIFVGRKSHKVSTKEAGVWTGIFVLASVLFGGYLHLVEGREQSTAFFTAYVIEKVLSVDNLFVFVMVFKFFEVPAEYHHKVLSWGVIGAIVMRGIFIFAVGGVMQYPIVELVLVFAFGLFLLYAGIKAGREAIGGGEEEEADYSNSAGAKFVRFFFGSRITANYEGDKFFVKKLVFVPSAVYDNMNRQKWVRYATPLLVVVGVVEFTDLLFAVDSIPAIFAVTKDPFILYSSNIFAILGLRTMYFLLANMLPKFTYLKHGLALILSFIGLKMIISPWVHIDSVVSLTLVLIVLVGAVVISWATRKTPVLS